MGRPKLPRTLKKCLWCDEPFVVRDVMRKFCSSPCASKHRGQVQSLEGFGPWTKGRKRGPQSEEHKQKIKNSIERNGGRSQHLVGRKGWHFTDAGKASIGAGVRRSWVRRQLEGGTPNYSKSAGYYTNGVWMRCLNSEGVFARELDKAGIQWVYEPKRFKLSWTSYCPDFYLPEFDVYVEVKGWLDSVSKRKIDSFRQETGKTLIVVMQSELPTLKWVS